MASTTLRPCTCAHNPPFGQAEIQQDEQVVLMEVPLLLLGEVTPLPPHSCMRWWTTTKLTQRGAGEGFLYSPPGRPTRNYWSMGTTRGAGGGLLMLWIGEQYMFLKT